MIIRKLFKFENAHIVRNCTSARCSESIHGHSYKIELLLQANALDNGQMVYDFGLLKSAVKDLIDSFDHAIAFWDKDSADYIKACQTFSKRWVSLPVSPSAEQFSRVIFTLADAVLANTVVQNNEQAVQVYSVIVHETDTGYAQCFRADIDNAQMGAIALAQIVFSPQIISEWGDQQLWAKLLSHTPLINPTAKQQVPL